MPRVTSHTARHSTKDRRCRGCGEKIEYGDQYFLWEKRYGGPQYRHTRCGYPRPTELSNRKTAQVEEAVQDANLHACESEDDLKSALSDIAGVARDVASQYSDSLSNMPDGLQQGAYAMEEISQELESWADDLESWSWDDDNPEEMEEGEERDRVLSDMRDSAEEVTQNMPEYQG